MENSRQNHGKSKWFDSELFIINGIPLKFNLEGFDLCLIRQIVRIIQGFGGKFCPNPNDPDTITFCEDDYPFELAPGTHDRYDIVYLFESICARRIWDLKEYKLKPEISVSTYEKIESPEDDNAEMENSGKNNVESRFFNLELFTIDGAPFKFTLEGYDLHTIGLIADIIEGFGGKFCAYPDDPDTVVFCEADYHSLNGPGKYDRYDTKYLFHSICAYAMLELEEYKLPVSTKKKI